MATLLHVFNRYLYYGGEEKIIEDIQAQLAQHHQVERCFYDSRDWRGPGAPSTLGQATRLFYNRESRRRFEAAAQQHRPAAALFHNLYPVASPSLYKAALDQRLPVLQYLHNFRPFSVSGAAYSEGRLLPEALHGNYLREIRYRSWQGSVVKSALFALMLKLLHRSGWLRSVRGWIAISDFVRQRIVDAGVPASKVHTLKHAWQPMPRAPEHEDKGYYLCLARLVEQKGILPLLNAWRALHEQLGASTPQLQIAGEGPLVNLVQAHAAECSAIRYLGQVQGEAKEAALRGTRALIVPSTWWEPLGLVVYEAYDHGKPVLAARSGGLTETVCQGTTGLLHEPGDAGSLARDVLALEQMTAATRRQMGIAGREWLLRETSVTQWQTQFDGILQSAVESR